MGQIAKQLSSEDIRPRGLGVRELHQVNLSVIIPTFNERDNVTEIVDRLSRALVDLKWEVIFVDDASPDGTESAVRELSKLDSRVRLIYRHNRRGLSSAVVEGILAASADIVAVMDGDLQHDESILPPMYSKVSLGEADLVSASRFLREDGADGLSSKSRHQLSNSGVKLANKIFGLKITDPLTGFFVTRREVVVRALPNLSEVGFKILLDVIVSSKPAPVVAEEPFKFRERIHGESKLDNRVLYDFLLFIIEKKISRYIPLPATFISFALINSVGILVHMAIFWLAFLGLETSFFAAQLFGTGVAMTFNYTANNMLTFRSRRLKGVKFYLGFILFVCLCSAGVYANIGVSSMIHAQYSGLTALLPAMAGALITVVWNYVASHAFVWSRERAYASQR